MTSHSCDVTNLNPTAAHVQPVARAVDPLAAQVSRAVDDVLSAAGRRDGVPLLHVAAAAQLLAEVERGVGAAASVAASLGVDSALTADLEVRVHGLLATAGGLTAGPDLHIGT